jgi:hypothetical protein
VILEFFYDNKLLGLDSKLMESKKLYYVDKFYFVLDVFNEDEFKFKINVDDLRIQNAKHILSKFENGLYEKICKNEKLFDHSFFVDHAKFDTLHFFNHILCFEELKSFLFSLKSLQILNEDSKKLENLTGPYLSTFYLEKYDEESKEFSDDNVKTRKAVALFCKTHADKLAKDVFLLPIISKYDNVHHLKNAYKIISTYLNSIKNITPRLDYNLEVLFNFEEVARCLKMYFADEWLKYICCNTNKPLNFHEYHSNIYGMNIKRMYNPEELEKIVCDYYNTIVCIYNFLNREVANSNFDLKYVEPLKNYKLECSIFKGIQFNIVNRVHKIRAYNHLSKEILLEENLYYYKFDYTSFQTFVFPFEVMKEYKISEIEFVFSDENNKKIRISDYLCIQEEDCKIEEIGKQTSKLSLNLDE